MTGTGSQTDPYIVENWSDFVTAISTSGAYVSCPNQEWDMNEIAPEGISTISCNCTEIQGNGLIIRNLYVTSTFLTNVSANIYDLKILDFEHTGTSYFIYGAYLNSAYGYDMFFKRCVFSGKSATTTYLFGQRSSHISLYQCSFNISITGGGCLGDFSRYSSNYSTYASYINDCRIILSYHNIVPTNQIFNSAMIRNSFISISAPQDSILNLSGLYINYSIITGNVINGGIITSSVNILTLYNSDVFPNTDNTNIPLLTPVTTMQLKDASYLSDIGFLIGAL